MLGKRWLELCSKAWLETWQNESLAPHLHWGSHHHWNYDIWKMLVKEASADTLALSGKHSNIWVSVFLYINTMPVAPVDSLLIYTSLKRRRVCLLVLGLIVLITYCTTLSKAVFDFSNTSAMTSQPGISPGLSKAENLACGGGTQGKQGDGERADGSPIEKALRNSWTSKFTDLKLI